MSKLDGIKDFIEKNKESLEKMNEEMIARCGQVPLVWLTVEEAEILTRCAANEFYRLIMEQGPVDLTRQVEVLMYDLANRIAQVETTKVSNDYNNALNKAIEALQDQEEIVNLKCEIEQLKAEQELDNWLKKTGF